MTPSPQLAALRSSWTAVTPFIHRAADHFRSTLADRLRPPLPEREMPLFLATLGHLIAGDDHHAGRTALLAALAPTYQHLGMQPHHHDLLLDALIATIARHTSGWTPETADHWQRHGRHALNLTHRAATRIGGGPAWTPAEIIDREHAADTITILTLRPRRRLRYQAGQAIPVTTLRRPGVWRWYSPANALRPDGTIELHIRAITAGPVSPLLAHHTAIGEQLWLGAPYTMGLTLDPNHDGDLLLAAGGTGLAPLRAIVEHLAANSVRLHSTHGTDLILTAGGTGLAPLRAVTEHLAGIRPRRRVTLVVGARTMPDLYDSVALDKLQTTHHDWLTVVPALSNDPLVEPASQGDVLTLALQHYQPGQHVFVAGPPDLITHARLRLPAAGVPAGHLHVAETFTRHTA
ncbi:FAD-binding oxidoreductase [Micromonospora sp. NPDC048830]|uniref:FAD-binding oxidoreductase n=1 Tax=Micromonospora sp. NPDC048830 TaxID=3364257 RepID=UPI00371AE716